jgi:hypothetical protein
MRIRRRIKIRGIDKYFLEFAKKGGEVITPLFIEQKIQVHAYEFMEGISIGRRSDSGCFEGGRAAGEGKGADMHR